MSTNVRVFEAMAFAAPLKSVGSLFLANVTGEPHPVRVEGLAGIARSCALGEADGGECGLEPELAPHAIMRMDVRHHRS